jgi:hypothetical protein
MCLKRRQLNPATCDEKNYSQEKERKKVCFKHKKKKNDVVADPAFLFFFLPQLPARSTISACSASLFSNFTLFWFFSSSTRKCDRTISTR